MLLIIAGLILGVFLYRRILRLEGTGSDVVQEATVRAYVDGKPVRTYLKE